MASLLNNFMLNAQDTQDQFDTDAIEAQFNDRFQPLTDELLDHLDAMAAQSIATAAGGPSTLPSTHSQPAPWARLDAPFAVPGQQPVAWANAQNVAATKTVVLAFAAQHAPALVIETAEFDICNGAFVVARNSLSPEDRFEFKLAADGALLVWDGTQTQWPAGGKQKVWAAV